jgi:hypothetical protein
VRARSPILAAAALVGLVLGPTLDQIHVQTGTLSYAHPTWLEQAWWVAPQFAIAFAVIAAASLGILAQERSAPTPSPGRVAWCIVAFVGAYAVTGLGHEHESLVLVALAAGLLARLVLERPDRAAANAISGLIVGGTAYEWALTSIPGTFDYAVASLGTVPSWLPLLYAHGGFAVVALLRQATAQREPDPHR